MNQFLKTKSEITAWLNSYRILNYKLVPDDTYGFVVDTEGGIDLSRRNLPSIPIKFNEVKGHFDCSHNCLTNLEGVPQRVGQYFYCSYNQLTSLAGCTQIIDGNFHCAYNQITSLEYCPQSVSGGYFDCSNNPELGAAQDIRNFNEIYQIHQDIITSKVEKSLLDDLLLPNDYKKISNTHKI